MTPILKYAGHSDIEEVLHSARQLRTDGDLRANIRTKTDNLHGFYKAVTMLESRALNDKAAIEFHNNGKQKARFTQESLAALVESADLMTALWNLAYTGSKEHKRLVVLGYFKESAA